MSHFLHTSNIADPEVLERLRDVARVGSGWMALCPAHDDTNPSLRINVKESGIVLMYCHACHATGADIAETLAAGSSDSHEAPGRVESSTVRKQPAETARYRYVDELAQPLYDVVRYGEGPSKTFRMHLPARGSGGVGEVRRVLYRLPDVIRAKLGGQIIYVVEGEKDVDRLRSHGLTATTNPNGAGKWKDEYSEVLSGATVRILPDNDDPGRDHANEVKTSLGQYGVDVEIVSLAGLPTKGDVSDWLDQGHAPDELDTIIQDAPHLEEPQRKTSPEPPDVVRESVDRASASLIQWNGFFDKDWAGEEWIVEPIIPRNRQVVIYSKAKQGKSLLMLEIAAAIATGRAVVGRSAGQAERVLYVDKEMTEEDLWERLVDLGYTAQDELLLTENLAYYQLPTLPPMDTKSGGEVLLQIALNHQAELVVIDTMSRVVQGEENANDTWQNFFLHTGMPLKQHGITLVRLDHSGKNAAKGQRGGSAKYDDPDVVFELTYAPPRVELRTKSVSRMSWVPDTVTLTRQEDPLRHTWTEPVYTARERALAALLDRLGVPVDMGKKRARDLVNERRAAGDLTSDDESIATASSVIWANAIRLRKSGTTARTTPRTTNLETPDTTPRTTTDESLHSKARTTPRTTENHSPPRVGTGSHPLGGNQSPSNPQPTLEDGS